MIVKILAASAIALLFARLPLFSQSDDAIKQLIVHNDSLFWNAYNSCDITGMQQFLTDDVEFYHDKGGPLFGINEMVGALKKNLCSNYADFHLRREAVSGSVQVYPMKQSDTIYGAVISGQHYFYINEKGKQEFKDGLARFTQLWLLKNGSWKMARILSFDHGPAPH